MEKGMTPAQIAVTVRGTRMGADGSEMHALSIDSRDENPGGIFVCIPGERFDGHDFAKCAVENGAACVITQHDCDTAGATEIRVQSTERALGDLASAYRDIMDPIVVAVTGSVGKTTTKQFLYAVLNAAMPTHCTKGNFNNQIGLPLTVLGLTSSHRAAVLEMGMNHKGEIARLSEIAKPDIAVITNIGNSHIEYLGSREGIRDAKMEIVRGLKKGGTLLLNGDEPLLADVPGAVYLSFDNPLSQYRVSGVVTEETASVFDLICPDKTIRSLRAPVVGRHNVYDAAVACTVGCLLGVSEDAIRTGLAAFENTGMRQRIYTAHGITVIEDCYNASPESMKAAVAVLCDTAKRKNGRSVAVLGDMLELGAHSAQLHREVGAYLAQNGVDLLIPFGTEAQNIANGAREAGMDDCQIQMPQTDVLRVGKALQTAVRAGDTVLFKGSRGMQMERLIPYLETENTGE